MPEESGVGFASAGTTNGVAVLGTVVPPVPPLALDPLPPKAVLPVPPVPLLVLPVLPAPVLVLPPVLDEPPPQTPQVMSHSLLS